MDIRITCISNRRVMMMSLERLLRIPFTFSFLALSLQLPLPFSCPLELGELPPWISRDHTWIDCACCSG